MDERRIDLFTESCQAIRVGPEQLVNERFGAAKRPRPLPTRARHQSHDAVTRLTASA